MGLSTVAALFFVFLTQGGVSASTGSGDLILPPVLHGFGFPDSFINHGGHSYSYQAGSHLAPAYDSIPSREVPRQIPYTPWIVDKAAAQLGLVIPVDSDSEPAFLLEPMEKTSASGQKEASRHTENHPSNGVSAKESYGKPKGNENYGGSSFSGEDFDVKSEFHDDFDSHSHDGDDYFGKNREEESGADSKFRDYEFEDVKSQSIKDSNSHKEIQPKTEGKTQDMNGRPYEGGAKSGYQPHQKPMAPPSPLFKPSQPDPLYLILKSHSNHNDVVSKFAPVDPHSHSIPAQQQQSIAQIVGNHPTQHFY